MQTFSILALSALFAASANAVPMAKRDIVWVTETDIDIITVPVTKTVWVDGPNTIDVHHHHQHKSLHTIHLTSTVSVAPAGYTTTPPAPASTPESSSSVYVAPTSSSVYVAPTPSPSSVYVAPTTSSTPVYVPPPPPTTSSSVYVAPTSAPAPYQPPTSTTSQPASTPASGSGAAHTGDLTYYATGLGSCGLTSTDSDAIVALAADMMMPLDGDNPNNNPLCGKQISITWHGVTKTATIVDTCPGCSGAGLDLSPSLFSCFADQSVGVLDSATWVYS